MLLPEKYMKPQINKYYCIIKIDQRCGAFSIPPTNE